MSDIREVSYFISLSIGAKKWMALNVFDKVIYGHKTITIFTFLKIPKVMKIVVGC
jgi:hypothetical protein